MQTIGFIGTGNMAKAIIGGIINSKEKITIIGYDKNENNYDFLKKLGVNFLNSSKEVVKISKYVVLAVKPQNYEEVLNEIKNFIIKENVLISIAAGINEDYVKFFLGFDVKFVQVMPNTPLILGCGAVAICKGEFVSETEFNFSKNLFSFSGEVCEIEKNLMNDIIAINGSSPAFIYYFTKGFLEFAKEKGIEQKKALKLFCQTLIGSAKMMLHSKKEIDELIKEVTSKKGTTEKGLEVLKEKNFLEIVKKTCEETSKRAFELSK